ncbi:MAG: phosphoenolpyruvate carboxykinase (ATP) [Bdellovibrionaceae bacterium]|nr:phosphoenolpyruvate carboxykinase (ATP) [Pseudobdellovibrionaceae bacterium]
MDSATLKMQKELIKQSILNSLGEEGPQGSFLVKTGKCTGRSTKERFLVEHSDTKDNFFWGTVNKALDTKTGTNFIDSVKKYVLSKKNYSLKAFVGCFPVEVYSTSPWHVAFAYNMFRSHAVESLRGQISKDFKIQIWHAPEVSVKDIRAELNKDITFPFEERGVVLDPTKGQVAIVGTGYAGEIKKAAFSVCNYKFPEDKIFPMHASANCNQDGKEACILFGLSGTGKTTLSADPDRYLIGDDEIVWSHEGLSNMEGGCYAKLINLEESKEPEIYKAVHKEGSILENVYYNEDKVIDFFSNVYTENTRGSYSLEALDKVFRQNIESSHPKSIIFLTADAFGALPAVARLNQWQAQYHFISGYTAKVAGTEIGVTEPEATFSSCFGAPFMPRAAKVYAELLTKLSKKYDVPVWLVNTGWQGGYAKGKRFPISVSRTLLKAIQDGSLNNVPMKQHAIFGFDVPTQCPGLDADYLQIPEGKVVKELAVKFMENIQNLGAAVISDEVVKKGGPVI